MKESGKKAWNDRESDGVRWKRRILEAVEDYLEDCAHLKVDIEVVKVDVEVLDSLLKPENQEVSLSRYVLKYSTRRGSNMFQLSDTSEWPNHFVASRRRKWESEGEAWSEDESVSSTASHGVGKGGTELPHGPGHAVPGIE